MAGNVLEWCNSFWSKDSHRRVLRGGSFYHTVASYVRSAFRNYYDPVDRNYSFGFRVARTYP